MRPFPSVAAVLALAALGCGNQVSEGPGTALVVAAEDIEVWPGPARFTSVRDLAVSGSSVWVLDGGPPFLTRVSQGTGEALTVGGRGQGPGEFLNPVAILAESSAGGPKVWVWDYGNGRVNAFDSGGAFLGSEPMDERGAVSARTDLGQVSFVDPFRIRSDGAGLLVAHFPRRVDRTSDILTGSVHRADERLTLGPALARFADHAAGGAALLAEWAAMPLWDACEGRLFLWSPDSSRVVWFDGEGRFGGAAPVDLPPGPVTLTDIERYLRHMARLELGPQYEDAGIDFPGMAAARRNQFPETRPLVTDIRCESRDAVWLRLFDTEPDPVGRARTWIRVPAAGPLEGVAFPDEFTPILFTPGGVLGALETPMGHQRLARWPGLGPIHARPTSTR